MSRATVLHSPGSRNAAGHNSAHHGEPETSPAAEGRLTACQRVYAAGHGALLGIWLAFLLAVAFGMCNSNFS